MLTLGNARISSADTVTLITVSEQNLADLLFKGNTDIAETMNQILQAKESVNVARGELLPSIDLDLVNSFTSAPFFQANSISCLVPFLFPSKWYDYHAAKDNYKAAVDGLYATKLNAYAEAYTLAVRIQADHTMADTMKDQRDWVNNYVMELKTQADVGLASRDDLLKGELEAGQADVASSKASELVARERAAFRRLLGLEINQDFVIAVAAPGPATFETMSISESVDQAVERAVERDQLDDLIAGAKANVRSAEWAFLQGCSGDQGANGTSASSTGFGVDQRYQVGIGFGYWPRVKIAKDKLDALRIRQEELRLEFGKNIETTLTSLGETSKQVEYASADVNVAETLLKEQMAYFEAGKGSAKDILVTYRDVTDARLTAISSAADLAGHRITLQRLALDDRFFQILIDSRRQVEIPHHKDDQAKTPPQPKPEKKKHEKKKHEKKKPGEHHEILSLN